MGANSRSTVGTATDAYSMLRIDLQPAGEPHVGPSNLFSFNDPQGMCPECEGLGQVSTIDVDALVDRDKSLNEGAITFPNFEVDSWYWQIFADSGFFDNDKPLRDYTDDEWDQLLYGPRPRSRPAASTPPTRAWSTSSSGRTWPRTSTRCRRTSRAAVERIATFAACPACGGARLNPTVLSVADRRANIAECAAMQVSDLAGWVTALDEPSVGADARDAAGDRSTTWSRSASAT